MASNKTAKAEKKHISPELISLVIDGEYGTQGERSRKLTADGYNPSSVTKKIHDLEALAKQVSPYRDLAKEYWPAVVKILELE
jgi:hypothetical protein